MQIVSSLLFGLSANLDSLAIGISYGIKKIRIRIAGSAFPDQAEKIGAVMLILLGIWFIWGAFRNEKKETKKEETKSRKENRDAKIRELIALGIALTVNNIGVGIGASISGIDPTIATAVTFSVSILFIAVGQFVGKRCLSDRFGGLAETASGLIVLSLGVLEFFT